MYRFELLIVNGMALLAVFVQLAVYGATKIRSNWAPLSSWAPYFGAPYGAAFLGLQLWYCYSCRHRRSLLRPGGLGLHRGALSLVRTEGVAPLQLRRAHGPVVGG